MDFWLLGYVKSTLYQFHPQTVYDLKDAMRTEIQEISIAMVRAAVLSIICRMQSVIICEGGHVENLCNATIFFLFYAESLSFLVFFAKKKKK